MCRDYGKLINAITLRSFSDHQAPSLRNSAGQLIMFRVAHHLPVDDYAVLSVDVGQVAVLYVLDFRVVSRFLFSRDFAEAQKYAAEEADGEMYRHQVAEAVDAPQADVQGVDADCPEEVAYVFREVVEEKNQGHEKAFQVFRTNFKENCDDWQREDFEEQRVDSRVKQNNGDRWNFRMAS